MHFIMGMVLFFARKCSAVSVFLLALCLHAGSLHAGDSISFHQEFSFSQYPNYRTSIINHFLLKIAEGNGKLRVSTSYTVEGTLWYDFFYDQQGRCAIGLQVDYLSFTGDVSYKAFGLEKLLTPDRLSFDLRMTSADGDFDRAESFAGVEVAADGTSRVVTSGVDWCKIPGLQLEITRLQLYYSEGIFRSFDDWLVALETYYKAGIVLKELEPVLVGLRFDDPERLIMDEFILCEAEQRLADVRYASFHRWLDWSRGDPERLLVDYDRLSLLSDSLRRGFNMAIANIDMLFYEKAISLQAASDAEPAQRLFHQALVYNPFHIPSKLSIASHELSRGNKGMALRRLEKILSEIFPSGDWLEHTVALSDSVLHEYFMDVLELTVDGRFLDALGLLGDVERFCNTTEGRFVCPELLLYHQTLAHQGMFRSFMVVSERAFKNGNLSFCAGYLRNALDYQADNHLFVPDRSQAVALMQQVVAQHRSEGNALYAKGDFIGASASFMKARELCEEFTFLGCSE